VVRGEKRQPQSEGVAREETKERRRKSGTRNTGRARRGGDQKGKKARKEEKEDAFASGGQVLYVKEGWAGEKKRPEPRNGCGGGGQGKNSKLYQGP